MLHAYFKLSVGVATGLLLLALSSCGSTGNSGGNGTSGTSTNGPVSISTDHTSYQPSDAIKVSVTNHLLKSIFAYDTRASCTILALQVQANGTWHDTQIAGCSLGRPAMLVEIGAGKVYNATISAGSMGISQATFPSDTYRLILPYTTSATPPPLQSGSKNMITIYSATFSVT